MTPQAQIKNFNRSEYVGPSTMRAWGQQFIHNMMGATSHTDHKISYFSFGANMNSQTLLKRQLSPNQLSSVQVARVSDKRLWFAFAHRGAYSTLVDTTANWFQYTDPAAQALMYQQPYGVLYQLTEDELQKLIAKEIGYQLIDILVTTADSGTPVQAKTFISQPWLQLRRPVKPTERYKALVLQGAQQNNLPAEYIEWLEQLPTIPQRELYQPQYHDTIIELVAKSTGLAIASAAIGIAITGML